jgi:hypothetical protein
VHDIFLRAYAVSANQKHRWKQAARPSRDPKWPEHALIFDTETRITADQSLTFGVYRLCKRAGNRYRVTQEGLFYADNLPPNEVAVLQTYRQSTISEARSFPPRFPLFSRSEFMQKVFWPEIKRHCSLICGFNLPFDLARLAVDWTRGNKDEWSLTMSEYEDGTENRNYPRILITPIDSKKAFIKLARPWKPKEWRDGGKAYSLDLRTLGWALFNESFRQVHIPSRGVLTPSSV